MPPLNDSAIVVNIGDMIDLAIGSPDVGVVDFNMLQTVLHCLAQQLRILSKNVELRGSAAVTLPSGRENSQTININEYPLTTDDKTPAKSPLPPPAEPDTILVVERMKKSESKSSPHASGARAHDATPVPLVAQPTSAGGPDKLSLVTVSKFNLLQDTVNDLKDRVYGSMPKNEAILEEVRSQTNLKAITDMWTSLNVSSRLEAAEIGIAKLSSLIQDLIAGTSGSLPSSGLEGSAQPEGSAVDGGQGQGGSAPAVCPAATKRELSALKANMEKLKVELDKLTSAFNATMNNILAVTDGVPPKPPKDASPAPAPAPKAPASMQSVMEKLNDLERRLNQCCDTIGQKDDYHQDQITNLQDQIDQLMRELTNMNEEVSSGKLAPDLIKDLEGLMQLFQTVQEMQDQLQKVHETALQLAAEKEDRQYHMNALLEQIELLKSIKLDREDMAEAMAEKADLRLLARKVSHDQFEIACDDLSKGLGHALGKLNLQESLWQQALDDIQREIESKLDKMELSPVKEFFNNKLKELQKNLKQMASLRREAEAAATKRKLLRDVNCIACDAKAVMVTELPTTLPLAKSMPATLSMKPYLTYELDAIRKTQASSAPQRNMRDWETIDKQMTQARPPQKVRSDTDKHLCNRYCGGSHTVTTAAQRVARTGHFIKQWGPDVLPLSSVLAAGDDGKLYRVNPEPPPVCPGETIEGTCTPVKQPKKPPKTIIISAECRCLEGGMEED